MNKYTIIAVLSLIVIFSVVSLKFNSPQPTKLGSIIEGQSYQSTSTGPSWDSTHFAKTLKASPGELGSVIIGSKDNGGSSLIKIYDASTTSNGSIYGTTTLLVIGTSTPAGTYQVDLQFKTGIVVEVPSSGILASSTITFR